MLLRLYATTSSFVSREDSDSSKNQGGAEAKGEGMREKLPMGGSCSEEEKGAKLLCGKERFSG
jgi:hypothetical protein